MTRRRIPIATLVAVSFGLGMSFISVKKEQKPLKLNSKKMLEQHNYYRAEVGVSPLTWSEDLTTHAQFWADSLALTCNFEHQDGHYGENIFWTTVKNKDERDVVDFWADEKENFNSKELVFYKDSCGAYKHYSQIIWEKTLTMGAARQRCDNGEEIWVCVYWPKGNIDGELIYNPKD